MARKDKIKDKVKKDKRFKDKTDEEQQDIADFCDEELIIRLDIEIVPTAKMKDLIP